MKIPRTITTIILLMIGLLSTADDTCAALRAAAWLIASD